MIGLYDILDLGFGYSGSSAQKQQKYGKNFCRWGRLGRRSWKLIDGAFDRLAKWWKIAVDQFEFQTEEKMLGPKNDFLNIVFGP